MRPGKWGNPFYIGLDGTREEVVAKFAAAIADWPDEAFAELRGRDLLCCCAPLPCHGDPLLARANRDTPGGSITAHQNI